MLTIGQIILRLILSTLFSGLIGLEREFKHKPAGLRTNILVGLGSTLIMLISIYIADMGSGDPGRVAAGVVTGIGFLGAGVIMRGRNHEAEEEMIQGITTAASIWLVAAVGLAVGMGFYSAALITTVIALVILYFFSEEKLRKIVKLKK